MRRVFITGVSGYIGMKLAEELVRRDKVDEIVGIDVNRPPRDIPKLIFYERDVRHPVDDILGKHGIDTIIHAAFILSPTHDKRNMEDININGTRNILASAAAAGVHHILYTSSATAYGFYGDNPVPLTEEDGLRGNDSITYSKTKRIIEEIFRDFLARNPHITATILRPSFVVGPGFDNPLARHLRKKLVFLPRKTTPLQFVHEDDLMEIIIMMLEKGKGGIFNVGARGAMSVYDMARRLGNIPVPLPAPLLYPFNALAWALRLSMLTEFPSSMLLLIRHPWIVSSEKLEKATGYTFQYDTIRAFDIYAAHICQRVMR
ncbi:MAG: hypothetical protein CVV44_22865 [Spirochaetae bacterium HGW-Spirochaetae-1]|jgi:UDP-glucose 4-epimerase|nr:MAG: hypothetical protein CVV44_22865 [Spirochaetae bacterium HGW-Spirochaetae-1]